MFGKRTGLLLVLCYELLLGRGAGELKGGGWALRAIKTRKVGRPPNPPATLAVGLTTLFFHVLRNDGVQASLQASLVRLLVRQGVRDAEELLPPRLRPQRESTHLLPNACLATQCLSCYPMLCLSCCLVLLCSRLENAPNG